MTKRPNISSENESPNMEELGEDQTGAPDLQRKDQPNSYSSRKAAKSKREIMEDLSRARFPWDE